MEEVELLLVRFRKTAVRQLLVILRIVVILSVGFLKAMLRVLLAAPFVIPIVAVGTVLSFGAAFSLIAYVWWFQGQTALLYIAAGQFVAIGLLLWGLSYLREKI